jgi:hypothetical protein
MNLRALSTMLLLLSACEPDFTPYNELEGLRVLSVRADHPELVPGETATLDALIFSDVGDASLRWELCPWPSEPNDGFRCLVDQATFAAVWNDVRVAGEVPALALGSAPTASLTFPGDLAEARALCEAMLEALDEAPALPPDCTRSWPWTVRLTARAGSAEVQTVKTIALLLDEALVPNQNPALMALTADGKALSEAPVDLQTRKDHALALTLADGAIETYLPTPALGEAQQPAVKETLLFTWFVTRGETEFMRTVFKDGVESLGKALKNTFSTPKETGDAVLYVVVRDGRGGVGHLRRSVRLTD